jgi:hypothetical protein
LPTRTPAAISAFQFRSHATGAAKCHPTSNFLGEKYASFEIIRRHVPAGAAMP